MKKREKEFIEEDDELKKRVRAAFKREPVEENRELADKFFDLFFTLMDYFRYQDFDKEFAEAEKRFIKAKKAYKRLHTHKRCMKCMAAGTARNRLLDSHNKTDIKAVEEKLKEYEKWLDKKYWILGLLMSTERQIRFGELNSLEEAVADMEKNLPYYIKN